MTIDARNTSQVVLAWAEKALEDSILLTEETKHLLLVAAKLEIADGGLHGDVSDRWRKHGITTEHVRDLY